MMESQSSFHALIWSSPGLSVISARNHHRRITPRASSRRRKRTHATSSQVTVSVGFRWPMPSSGETRLTQASHADPNA